MPPATQIGGAQLTVSSTRTKVAYGQLAGGGGETVPPMVKSPLSGSITVALVLSMKARSPQKSAACTLLYWPSLDPEKFPPMGTSPRTSTRICPSAHTLALRLAMLHGVCEGAKWRAWFG